MDGVSLIYRGLSRPTQTHKPRPSPIQRLPPEILAEIFSLVVHATFHFRDISEVSGPVSHQAPWIFARVSRHWAEVALGTSALWSMVFLDLDRVGERGAVPLTKLLHERSRNVPLTVNISCEDPALDTHLVLDTALSHAERWVVVDIYLALPLFRQFATIRSRLSALTILKISLYIDDDIEVDAGLRNTFAVAPNLTDVHATFQDDLDLRCARNPFVFPWQQLTRLSSTFLSSTEALSVLRKLSNIVDCRLEYEEVEIFPENIIPTRLPHLRSLSLMIAEEFTDPEEYVHSSSSLLGCIETPCLERLSTYWTADEAAVLSLLTRSGCIESVNFLHFHCASIIPGNILALVQKMPRLTDLDIGDFNSALLPQSSLPTFVDAFSSSWLAAQNTDGRLRQTLRVRIVDSMLDPAPELSVMQKDGLFIEISQRTYFPDIFGDCFY
ncbi:hypothetical protein DFH07DRAFT_44303 [Mycena maculata]|uniref:F-box domain-containing protein n=1 Tax=Mycena maculata TaxID=230809 RepID=A0AAD7N1D7_9AGAR|nr:hypothetical protein DFH07DRAFT_44303 [Mycena maculata]